jgi:uncharacterized protein (TIGR03067 family)
MPRTYSRLASLAGLALALAALTLSARAGDGKKDRERLQGTWKLVKLFAKGEAVPAKLLEGTTLVIKGETMITVVVKNGKEKKLKGTYKLDPSRKPREIDIVADEGPNKGTKELGIYELDGDTLRVALNRDKRPTDFTTGEKSMTGVYTFQRIKK